MVGDEKKSSLKFYNVYLGNYERPNYVLIKSLLQRKRTKVRG